MPRPYQYTETGQVDPVLVDGSGVPIPGAQLNRQIPTGGPGVTLTPGAGIIITGGPAYTISALAVAQPLLSYVGIGAICAYGLRQLVSTYDGPILNVTRPASGTSQQIFPAAGTLDLDTAALIAFAAGADVFVDTWYDQIGGGHMTQPIAANRPQICVAGALITLPNGRPAIKTDGVSQWLDVSSPTVNQPLTRVSVLKFLSVAAGQNLTSDNATNSLNMNAVGSLATFAGANVAFKTGIAVNDLAAVYEVLNGPSSRWVYNGVRGTYNPGGGATQRRSIGASFSGAAGSFFAGLYSEQIVWNRQVSRYEEKLIYDNQKLYWGVP